MIRWFAHWLFVILDWVWIWLYAFALSFSLSLFSVFALPMLLLLLFVCCIPLFTPLTHFNTAILPLLEEYYIDNSFKCIAPLFPPASLLFFQLCSLITLHVLSHKAYIFLDSQLQFCIDFSILFSSPRH